MKRIFLILIFLTLTIAVQAKVVPIEIDQRPAARGAQYGQTLMMTDFLAEIRLFIFGLNF